MAMTRRELRTLRTESSAGDPQREVSPPHATVLVVCTGNLVRSPFLAHLFASLGLDDMSFVSAGVRAVDGAAASTRVQELAREYGLDLSDHRARRLDEYTLAGASTVVCAAREHKKDVLRMDPSNLHRVFTLREICRAAEDLDDVDPATAPVARWDALVEHAGAHRRSTDDDDIPDPYRLGDRDWWEFEKSALGAALPVLRRLVGAHA